MRGDGIWHEPAANAWGWGSSDENRLKKPTDSRTVCDQNNHHNRITAAEKTNRFERKKKVEKTKKKKSELVDLLGIVHHRPSQPQTQRVVEALHLIIQGTLERQQRHNDAIHPPHVRQTFGVAPPRA
jgi:hypothetical protein